MERTASEHVYLAENARLLLVSYCAIPLSTAPNHSFPVPSKTKKIMELLQLCMRLNLRNLGCIVLDRGPLQTLWTVEMPSPHFFTLDHTHCHQAARERLSSSRTQSPKPLNNTKFCTATMSLRGPFHPGIHRFVNSSYVTLVLGACSGSLCLRLLFLRLTIFL